MLLRCDIKTVSYNVVLSSTTTSYNFSLHTSLTGLSTRSASIVKCESLKRLSGRLSIRLSSSAEYRSSEYEVSGRDLLPYLFSFTTAFGGSESDQRLHKLINVHNDTAVFTIIVGIHCKYMYLIKPFIKQKVFSIYLFRSACG